jgi:hypothetical protein
MEFMLRNEAGDEADVGLKKTYKVRGQEAGLQQVVILLEHQTLEALGEEPSMGD